MSRGLRWFDALAGHPAATAAAVRIADCAWGDESVRVVAVVPNPTGRFPRARSGQIGVEEGWAIAAAVREAIEADRDAKPRALVLIVDVPGQAFGYHEEALGLHQSLAAAVDAYAAARLAGHPVVALIVGKAISGAFLAHGLQASALFALDDDGIEVHVMSEASVARVTRRSESEIAALARIVPSTARDVHSFAGLGALDQLLQVDNADVPAPGDVARIQTLIVQTGHVLRTASRDLQQRLQTAAAQQARAASIHVRQLLEAQWDASA